MMALERVRREIGEPDEVAVRDVADRQRAAVFILVEGGLGPTPPAAIFGNTGPIVHPATRVGGAIEVADLEFQLAAGNTSDAEMKPLVEVGMTVLGDP